MRYIKHRNIILAIIFSIFTYGIYFIYWFVCLTNDSNAINPEKKTANGFLALVFSVLTLGLYLYYWAYKLGKKLKGSGAAYLIIFFILPWLVPILAQSEINKYAGTTLGGETESSYEQGSYQSSSQSAYNTDSQSADNASAVNKPIFNDSVVKQDGGISYEEEPQSEENFASLNDDE